GVHVTPKTDPGDYIIESTGDITLYAGNAIYLKNGFHAQSGADFHAYIEESDACFGSTSREIENTQNTEKSKPRNELDLTEKDNEKIRVENNEIKVYLYPNP